MPIRIWRLRPLAAALLASLIGCDGTLEAGDDDALGDDDATPVADDDAAPDDDASPADDDATSAPDDDTTPPPDPSYTASMEPIHFGPGAEDTYCVEVRLSNPEPIWVDRIRTRINEGGHHTIVYRSNATEEHTEPFRCFPFIETLYGENVPVMITQVEEEELAFPEGTALRLEATQMVRIETHFLNTNETSIDAFAEVEFVTTPEASVTDEIDFLFLGSIDVEVPPGGSTTLGPRYVGFPGSMADIQVFAATGHTHSQGTDVSLWRSEGAGDLDEKIYPTTDEWYWDEPETAQYDPPYAFPGGTGMSISCSWENTTGQWLGLGESAEDEMCFAWAYYYPSQGYKLCVETEYLGPSLSLCCPSEDPLCEYLYDYIGL